MINPPTIPLRCTPNFWILALSLLMLPVLVGLGFWQLSRADEKAQIEQHIEQRQTAAPVDLSELTEPLVYTPVFASGFFDTDHIWLLDNRQRAGKPGYEVVQPFELDDGRRVLVNRGWLPAPSLRQDLPTVEAVQGRATIFAQIALPSDHPMLSAQSAVASWPQVITEISPAVMGQSLGEPLADYYLKLDAASTGAFITAWQPINMSAAKHTGYAVQWFAMAFALVVLCVFANSNLAQVLKKKHGR